MDIGAYNYLRVERATSVGWFLKDDEGEEVLLPNKWAPPQISEGAKLKVFVYLDSEERPIATTQKPLATVGDFAHLKVRQVTSFGAFLEWGLEKDLLVPFSEMEVPMEAGRSYPMALYLDAKTNRVVASSRLKRFFKTNTEDLEKHQEVSILVWNKSELGVQAVVENSFAGLLYHNELFEPLNIGQQRMAYISNIRADGKLDLRLQKPGVANIEPNAAKILEALKASPQGFLPLHDKSEPEAISAALGMSKKTFKKAVGTLYKQKLIEIKNGKGIQLK